MKAIILAAGRGRRMGSLTRQTHKCQTQLHGKSLLNWQLDALKTAGIRTIAIVTGYLPDTIYAANTHRFYNKRWHETNMVSSLLCASQWLENEPCIVSYSDIVYSSTVVHALVNHHKPLVISYDPNWLNLWELRFNNPLDDAETFRINGDSVAQIGGKAKHIRDIQGQYMGLLKITPPAWAAIRTFLRQISTENIDALDMTGLLQKLIETQTLAVNAIAVHEHWYEVDSESDLLAYETQPAVR